MKIKFLSLLALGLLLLSLASCNKDSDNEDINTFSFVLSSLDSISSKPISSLVTITSGSDYTYTQELDTILTNVAQIKDGYDSYYLTFTKDGYTSCTDTFTNEELKSYSASTLMVIMMTDSIFAKYPLDGDFNDHSGHNFNLTSSNVEYCSDRSGNASSACYFDGTAGSYANNQTMFNQSSEQSVSLWFKTTDANTTSSYGGFLFIVNGSGTNRFSINMSNGYLRGHYGVGSSSEDDLDLDRVETTATYNDGVWHHVVYVSTGDGGTISLYVDGQLDGTKELTRSNHSTTTPITLKIGGNDSNNYFTGAIDDIVYLNKALSAEEVLKIYSAN